MKYETISSRVTASDSISVNSTGPFFSRAVRLNTHCSMVKRSRVMERNTRPGSSLCVCRASIRSSARTSPSSESPVSSTGCGGSGQLADDEVQIGPFTVKVFGLDVDLGTESGTDKGAITGKVRLRYDAGGGSWQGGQYGDMFQASVGEAKLKQVSPAGTFFVSDKLLGKPFATEEKDLRLNFPDAEIKEAYRNGQPAVLKIVINGISETLFLVKKNGGYAATKTLPSLTTV